LKDTSIIEDNRNIIFNDKLVSLEEDENLVVLDNSIKVTKKEKELEIVTSPENTLSYNGDFSLLSNASIEDKYLFVAPREDSVWDNRYYFLNRKTGYFQESNRTIDRLIDSRGIYQSGLFIYAGSNPLVEIDADYKVSSLSHTIFGEKEEIVNISYNFDYNNNSNTSLLIRFVLENNNTKK